MPFCVSTASPARLLGGRRVEQRHSFVSHRENFQPTIKIRPSGSCFHQAQGLLSRRRSTSRLRNVDRTMSTNLAIVATNAEPNREQYYPQTWLLYGQGQNTVEVHVAHDSGRIPHVVDRSAA